MRQARKNSITEAVLNSFGYKPKTVKELAVKLNLTYEQVSGCCKNLDMYGKIKKVGRGTYQLMTKARKLRKNSVAETVLNALTYEPVTIAELVSKLNLTYEQVSACCYGLAEYGKAQRIGRGTYRKYQ